MISGYTTFDESGRYFTKILLFVFTAINVIIITSLIINVFYHKYQSNLNKLLKQQIDSQLSHYKKREDLNTEIRGFRHDFNNHVKCLESMMTMEKYDDAKAYLEKLTGMMPSAEFLFRTGNYVADAILTEIQEENKNITVKFSGVIPQSIDNADLCIVLSNAMNNAAEACGALSGNSTVSVYGNCQQGVFVLIVKNPTLQKGYAKNARHKTSKRDKIAHGFGLSNIQLVVKKYGGTMHTLLEDGMFTLSLTLSVEQAVYI
ncbi:MAG: GHKL domain-containing protein [Oscillospiraceae bacterium]|nr:GHKL domain-containing protein [Oscillospiraceae bacterium]